MARTPCTTMEDATAKRARKTAYMRKYRAENEPARQYQKQYNADNSDRLKEMKRKRREENPQLGREYRERRAEQVKQSGVTYRRDNSSAISLRRCAPESRAKQLVGNARSRAKQRGQFFAVSEARVIAAVVAGKCARTGRTFALVPRPNGFHSHPNSPSIDRIDSTGIYVDENVQIVCSVYNIAKGPGSDADLLALAADILRHAGWSVSPPQ